jgi:hypothetical protein
MSTIPYIVIIAAIILAAGWFGGAVNYIFQRRENSQANYRESVVVGIAAALLTPLFLSMIQSDLLAKGRQEQLALFTFAGLCLVAAITSRRFIESISDKVLKQLEATDQKADQAEKKAEAAQQGALKAVDKAIEKAAVVAEGAVISNMRQQEFDSAPGLPSAQGTGPGAVSFGVISTEALSTEAPTTPPSQPPQDLIARWLDLEDQYAESRQQIPSSSTRTSQMSGLVRQFVDLAPGLESFPLLDNLRSSDLGKRLGAYAYLYARPDFSALGELIQSAAQAEPFGQYWGIKAIGRLLGGKTRADIPAADLQALQTLLESLEREKRSSDRYYQLYRILNDLGE